MRTERVEVVDSCVSDRYAPDNGDLHVTRESALRHNLAARAAVKCHRFIVRECWRYRTKSCRDPPRGGSASKGVLGMVLFKGEARSVPASSNQSSRGGYFLVFRLAKTLKAEGVQTL
ncbi:hypothetical protein J6590_012694 [Homalodisca vitripennis]|nr:hypothetical protein J6590_012694 [Homalodisca vitripennis]